MNTVINVDEHMAAIHNAIERGVYIIVEEALEGVEDDVFFLYRYRPLKPGGRCNPVTIWGHTYSWAAM